MMRNYLYLLASAILFGAFLLAGLTAQPSLAAESVSIANFAFSPATITVIPGTTIVWTNQDSVAHTTTSDTGVWDSGVMVTGESRSISFPNSGTFAYHCAIHPFMKGTVVVAEASTPTVTPTASPSPSLTAPTLSGPADGATLTSFGPTLTWSNPPGVTQYHLEVIPANNDGPGANVIRDVESQFAVPPPPLWYGLLPDMTYTWRIQVTDKATFAPEGDPSWSPWAERRFRTPAVTSATITAVAPAAGAAVITLTPTLQWANSRTDVFYYELQLSKDQSFNTDPATATAMVYGALIHGGVTSPPNSYAVPAAFPLEPNTSYFWRIRPRVQGDGTPLAWTQSFVFTTSQMANVTPTPTATPTATPPATAPPAGGGYRIAFTSRRDGNEEIYVMQADGSGQTRLTNDSAIDTAPVWSPYGDKIAFVSSRDGNSEIYLMNPDGSDLKNLSNHASSDEQPVWSYYNQVLAPELARLAFVSTRDGRKNVYAIHADGSSLTRLNPVSNTDEEDQPKWFPDNLRLAYVCKYGTTEICTASLNIDVSLTRPTFNAEVDERPAVSPDGSKIGFVSERDGNREIYVMPANCKTNCESQTRLTVNLAQDDQPRWAPDSKKIAFESNRDGNWEIYLMNADGSGQTRLTNNPASDTRPVWSPDGQKIAFESNRDGAQEIYVMNADGSGQTNLTNNPAFDASPAWSPK